MKNTLQLRRTAAWLAVWALPLAYANVGLALVAVDFDLATFGDFLCLPQFVPHGWALICCASRGKGLRVGVKYETCFSGLLGGAKEILG